MNTPCLIPTPATMPGTLTLRDAWERYLKTEGDYRPRTIDSQENALMHWERLTENPDVREIVNAHLAEFKAKLLETHSPATFNSTRRRLAVIFNRLSPPGFRNPAGLSIIPRAPYVKPAKAIKKPPRRVDLDDVNRLYAACRHARTPAKFVSPVDWWRALIVVAYFTGLRRSDLLTTLTHDQIDLDAGELRFQALKTGKHDTFPLHPLAVEHLRRIWEPLGPARKGIFSGFAPDGGAYFYREFHRLLGIAGFQTEETRFGLHDLRRTAACEVDRVRSGLGAVLLQHAPRGVTEISYLNAWPELREAIPAMRVPVGFNVGTKMQDRAVQNVIRQQQQLRPADFVVPIKPPREFWTFQPGKLTAVSFRGSEWFNLGGKAVKILRALLDADAGVSAEDLLRLLGPSPATSPEAQRKRISLAVSELRRRLKTCLGLPASFDPIPCLGHGDALAYALHVPTEMLIDPARKRTSDTTAVARVPPTRVGDWQIETRIACVAFRGGELFRVGKKCLPILRVLIESRKPADYAAIVAGTSQKPTPEAITARVARLRGALRKGLGLPMTFDPLPCTTTPHGPAWTLRMPPAE